jgi:hypothetical protein
MHPLEEEIQEITEEFKSGSITLEQRNWLLSEIRDIRAAQECAGNEIAFRYVVVACDIAMAII